MRKLLLRIIEPKCSIEENQRMFSNEAIIRLILPLFFEQLLAMLVGIADTFMISYAGDAAVSGVSLVNMFNTIFIYLFTALACGGAVVVSQYVGSRNRKNADASASQLLMIATVIALFFMAVSLIWKRQLLGLMFGRVDSDVMDACMIYLRISAYSFPAIAIYNAGAALCRSIGKTSVTMYISVLSNVINVIGNAIGIFVLHAGVAGVAYPSLIARTFSAVAVTVLCFKSSNAVSYKIKRIFCWNKDMIGRIFKIAVPNGIENGQCMGAKNTDAADYYFRKLYRITLLTSVVWNALVLAVTPFFMNFYPLSDEVKQLVVLLVLIHNVFNAFLFPTSGALSNGLRAAGDVKYTMYLSVLSTVACRLVLSVVLGIWMNLGVIGIALAMCCDWAVRALFVSFRYKSGKWKNFRVI